MRRLSEHNEGLLGKFTKGKGPWVLIHQEEFTTKKEAIIREKELKTGKGRDFIKQKTGYKCPWSAASPRRRRFLEAPQKS